ncbi:MAG: stress protein, partial [Pseudomonadota bacterium]
HAPRDYCAPVAVARKDPPPAPSAPKADPAEARPARAPTPQPLAADQVQSQATPAQAATLPPSG